MNGVAQTGQGFTQVLNRWALANWVSNLSGFSAPAELTYTSWNFRSTYASLHAQDPADFPASFPLAPTQSAGSTVNVSGTMWPGSGVYHRAFQGLGGAGFTLLLTANGTASLPATIVPRLNVIRIR